MDEKLINKRVGVLPSILFECGDVPVFIGDDDSFSIVGTLLLVKSEAGVYLCWFPHDSGDAFYKVMDNFYKNGKHLSAFFSYKPLLDPIIAQNLARSQMESRVIVNPTKGRLGNISPLDLILCFETAQLYSMIKKISPNQGMYAEVELIYSEKIRLPKFHFKDNLRGLAELIRFVSPFCHRDRNQPQLYIFNTIRYHLNPDSKQSQHSPTKSMNNDYEQKKQGPVNPVKVVDGKWKFLNNFSKITKMANGAYQTVVQEQLLADPSMQERPGSSDLFLFDPVSNVSREDGQCASIQPVKEEETAMGILPILIKDNHFESIESQAHISSEQLMKIINYTDAPITMQNPINMATWISFLDPITGKVKDPLRVKEEIHYRGLIGEARQEAWLFILGFHGWDSTAKDREYSAKQQCREYVTIKKQWQSITESQAARFSKFRDRRQLIEKDVHRTDREIDIYKHNNSPNLNIMREALLTYAFYNFDLGYAQGMSDFISVILYIIKDEAEAFWCFAKLMDTKEALFHKQQAASKKELSMLVNLLCYCDRALYTHLKDNSFVFYDFCYRWIMVDLKREFTFKETISLWERLWTNPFSSYFIHFVHISLMIYQRDTVLSNDLSYEDILQLFLKSTQSIHTNISNNSSRPSSSTSIERYESDTQRKGSSGSQSLSESYVQIILNRAILLFQHCKNDPFFPKEMRDYYMDY